MKQYVVLKLIGLVILTMAILIGLSFLEVAIYSYLINPGQDQSVYEAHANVSAPYISGIFGFIIFFLVVKYWKKNEYPNVARLSLMLPVTYLIVDIIILTAAGVKWSDFIVIFVLANIAKFLGSYLGYTLTK
ncbi:MAG: hypothetical protein IPL63_05905 [Saprospiraceae bacterium]|nr:hypothetical protein [Saprospiraceae bacterium]MBK8081318.1 hypothetical protein [Saprospiraceae bacterium]MBK8370071.1 hypothetical protein [Saprospiraceae bacterium]MBK8546919.1 hypothetical protein [Saprospiraceae bacterium]MBK8820583.1 hypothetical protein [Saprospiraceae bacterium]